MHRHRVNQLLLLHRRQSAAPATWDRASSSFGTLSNGDLTWALSGGWREIYGTIGKTTGIHSFEMTFDSGSYSVIGFSVAGLPNQHDYPGEDGENAWGISSHGFNMSASGTASNGITFAPGDKVLGVLDRDNSRAKFYKLVTGAWSLVYDADISAADGVEMFPVIASLDGTATGNFGQSSFAAAPPGGAVEGFFP